MKNKNEFSSELWILSRITKAVDFLNIRKGLTQIQIVAELNSANKNPTTFRGSNKAFSTSALSSYYTAKSYTTGTNPKKAFKILKALESLLEEAPYKVIWNDHAEEYSENDESTTRLNIKKLTEFIGTWEAYSWDSSKSQDEKKGYVHCFKFKIESPESVICITQETTFAKGRLYLIGTEKVCIEISNNARKAYFVAHFGSVEVEEIQKHRVFILAYVDSGRYNVKAGIALIKRTEIDFNDIICESKPILQIKSHLPIAEKVLKDKQFMIF